MIFLKTKIGKILKNLKISKILKNLKLKIVFQKPVFPLLEKTDVDEEPAGGRRVALSSARRSLWFFSSDEASTC